MVIEVALTGKPSLLANDVEMPWLPKDEALAEPPSEAVAEEKLKPPFANMLVRLCGRKLLKKRC